MAISLLVDLGGLIAEDMYYEGEELYSKYVHVELWNAKSKGLYEVQQVVQRANNSRTSKLHFGFIKVSFNLANELIKGKYKKFRDFRIASDEEVDDKNITILYEYFDSDNGLIFLIDSFFIN